MTFKNEFNWTEYYVFPRISRVALISLCLWAFLHQPRRYINFSSIILRPWDLPRNSLALYQLKITELTGRRAIVIQEVMVKLSDFFNF